MAEVRNVQTRSTYQLLQYHRRYRVEYRLKNVSYLNHSILCLDQIRTKNVDRDLGTGPEKGHGNQRHDPLE